MHLKTFFYHPPYLRFTINIFYFKILVINFPDTKKINYLMTIILNLNYHNLHDNFKYLIFVNILSNLNLIFATKNLYIQLIIKFNSFDQKIIF